MNNVNDLVFYTELEKTIFLGYSILYDSNKTDETEILDNIKDGNIVIKQNTPLEKIQMVKRFIDNELNIY